MTPIPENPPLSWHQFEPHVNHNGSNRLRVGPWLSEIAMEITHHLQAKREIAGAKVYAENPAFIEVIIDQSYGPSEWSMNGHYSKGDGTN